MTGLLGCSASGTHSASATATPSQSLAPEPTPTVTAPAAEAASVVISGSGFVIVDSDDSTMFSHDWPDDISPAVDAMEKAFGSPPTESPRKGDGTHTADAILYEWDGFLLSDAQNLGRPREDYAWPSSVTIVVADINGVELRTVGGVSVGDVVNDTAGVVERYEGLDGSVNLVMDLVNPNASDAAGTTAVYVLTDVEGSSAVQIFSPGQYPGF